MAQAHWPIQQLADFLANHSISGAPVVSCSGTVVGVVSLTDLALYDRDGFAAPATADEPPSYYLVDLALRFPQRTSLRLRRNGGTVTGDIMTPALIAVDETSSLGEVADLLSRSQLYRLLVLRSGSDKKIAGIVTVTDLLDWIQRQSVHSIQRD